MRLSLDANQDEFETTPSLDISASPLPTNVQVSCVWTDIRSLKNMRDPCILMLHVYHLGRQLDALVELFQVQILVGRASIFN